MTDPHPQPQPVPQPSGFAPNYVVMAVNEKGSPAVVVGQGFVTQAAAEQASQFLAAQGFTCIVIED